MLRIAPLVRRNLQGTYHFVDAAPGDAPAGQSLALAAGEQIVGWYQNPPPHPSSVVFTDRAILLVEGHETRRLAYRDITSWRANAENRGDVTGLFVRCGREWVSVPFLGRTGPEGKYVDAWGLATILSAVMRTPRDEFTD